MDWDPQSTETHGYICPPCPVFHPTREEFQDPLQYISSIRHIGEQAGICKIVPPRGWRPPFAINDKTFRFRTRVQQLNCIDGHSRAEGNFVEALRMFLYTSGAPMQELPRIHGQLVNLRLLYRTVCELGGFDDVCTAKLWPQVVRRVGRTRSADAPDASLCAAYERHYARCLLAFERHEAATVSTKSSSSSFQTPDVSKRTSSSNNGTSGSSVATTPQSKTSTRSSSPKKAPPMAVDGDDVDADAPSSPLVKRTLFTTEGGHTSSEENDAQSSSSSNEALGATSKVELVTSDSGTKARAARLKRDTASSSTPEKKSDSGAGPKAAAPNLSPLALKPDPKRTTRLDAPEIVVGQKFFQFFPECGAVLAQVKRVAGGKKPHVVIQYVKDSSRDTVDLATMQILIANGWDPDAAELAYKSEICQTCLRGDCWEQMLLCDGCNSGHHLFCLEPPLTAVPSGDWYCSVCVAEATTSERELNPKFGFEMGSEYSVTAYKEKADAWQREYFGLARDAPAPSDRELEREYWRLLSIPVHEQRLEVEYGSDIDSGAVGSGFPRLDDAFAKCLRLVTKRLQQHHAAGTSKSAPPLFAHGLESVAAAAAADSSSSSTVAAALESLLESYARDAWNLNNLPKLAGSVLQHLDEDIKGVMVPWLYMGMCFSTFCWHVEDHNFYSMSYNHCGAPKTWYGVPGRSASHFEATMQKLTPELFGSQPDLHLQLVTMFSPATLRQHGVPVYRATHQPNEFMVTFPSAYHSGFNNGFNCAEAVNFATLDWLPLGAASVRKYRQFAKLPVFSHDALVWSLAETLVESRAFDVEAARTFLQPALVQLCDETNAFEARVAAAGVTAHEWMAAFEERYHNATVLPVRAAKKRMMASTECDDKDTEMIAAPASMRMGGKMSTVVPRMGGKMSTAVPPVRPSRMVLWAGQSGKAEGLRCVACKQYCYLQAVVCTKCRPSASVVGCVEHFATMCDCDAATHYVYLHRFDAAHLASVVAAVQKRLDAVADWDVKYDCAVARPDKAAKPSVAALAKLLADGQQCGGARRERLDALETAIRDAAEWTARAKQLLDQQRDSRDDNAAARRLAAVLDLLDAATSLAAKPEQFDALEQLAIEWRDCERTAAALLDSVAATQRDEAAADVDVRNVASVPALLYANEQHQTTIAALGDVAARVERLTLSTTPDDSNALVTQLQHAQQFLRVLVLANDVLAAVAKRIARITTATNTSDSPLHSSTDASSVSESACRRVVASADGLASPVPPIAKVEALRVLLVTTEAAALELRAALDDRSKSAEELAALLARLERLAIVPDAVPQLADRLAKCCAWEHKAAFVLALRSPVTQRPALQELEHFVAQADAWCVPTTSLLRRQLASRVQDCRRWYAAVHSVFVKPAAARDWSVAAFLKAAIASFHAAAADSRGLASSHAPSRLHCVCAQVMPDATHALACQRCSALFHAQCVDQTPVVRTRNGSTDTGFVCPDCQSVVGSSRRTGSTTSTNSDKQQQDQQDCDSSRGFPGSLALRATLGSQGVPLFCHCRGAEGASMICCDFCDEWYHAACIGMPLDVMTQIEAFRCQRCALQQRLYYLDKRAVRSSALGRRPALARVDALVTTLETSLLALPPGAHELLAYVALVRSLDAEAHTFATQFAATCAAAPSALAHVDFVAHERATLALLQRITALEVALDAAQGRLGAVHWCLRAGRTVLACDRAPKYAHLVVLLEDVQQPHFVFPCPEAAHMERTIADRVRTAAKWLKQAKTLEAEEWNVEKARRLLREWHDLSRFLELPVAEVNLVHQIVAAAAAAADDDDDVDDVDDVGYVEGYDVGYDNIGGYDGYDSGFVKRPRLM